MWKALESNPYLQRWYFKRSEFEKTLIWSCLFSVALVLVRVAYTKEGLFLSLIWNLFLAYLPYGISGWISEHKAWRNHTFKFYIPSLIWLLFIPNSFYIITDLFHLKETEIIPFWFDLALLFSFAWNGLILGVLSVRHMEKIIEQRIRIKNEWSFVYPIMLLNAIGIFIGRYWRFNSWDVVTNPFSLIRDILHLLLHPIEFRFDWCMIGCFSVLMTLLYSMLKKISKAIG